MAKEPRPKKPHDEYRLRTRLIHGSFATAKWDYDHHVVPPQSSSATYRLASVQRGAQGFVEFATPELRRAPIYIYDRLDEPSSKIGTILLPVWKMRLRSSDRTYRSGAGCCIIGRIPRMIAGFSGRGMLQNQQQQDSSL